MQAHGGLAGARAALDHERHVGVVGDQPVLVGLDRRDDVAHVPAARSLELLEQEVADGGAVEHRSIERLVCDVEQTAPVGAEAAAQRDAVRVVGRRGVEGPRRRCLPVDDDLLLLLVVHPAAPDVERPRHLLEVEPAEAEPALRILVRPQPPGGPGVHRGLRDFAVHRVACARDRPAHPLEVVVRPVDVRLLLLQVRVAHRSKRSGRLPGPPPTARP